MILFARIYLLVSIIFLIMATANKYHFDRDILSIEPNVYFALSAINIMFCYFVIRPHLLRLRSQTGSETN